MFVARAGLPSFSCFPVFSPPCCAVRVCFRSCLWLWRVLLFCLLLSLLFVFETVFGFARLWCIFVACAGLPSFPLCSRSFPLVSLFGLVFVHFASFCRFHRSGLFWVVLVVVRLWVFCCLCTCASRRSSRFFTNLYAGRPAFFMGRPHLHSGRPVRTGQEVRGSSLNRSNFLIFDIFLGKNTCFNLFFEDLGCTKGDS